MATWFEICAYIYVPIYKLVLTHRRNPKISFYLDDGPYWKQKTLTNLGPQKGSRKVKKIEEGTLI